MKIERGYLFSLIFLIALCISCRKSHKHVRTRYGNHNEKSVCNYGNNNSQSLDSIRTEEQNKIDNEEQIIKILDYAKNSIFLPEVIFRRMGYTISYNKETKQPNWVGWHLTAERVSDETYPRKGVPYKGNDGAVLGIGFVTSDMMSGDFIEDKDVPTPRQNRNDWKEKSVGLSKGHLCPAADNRWSREAINQSFLLSNVCPQNESLNNGLWHGLEKRCRNWAIRFGELYIVAGPVFTEYPPQNVMGINKIGIPDAFFKVVFCPNLRGESQMLGFIFPNADITGDTEHFLCTVDSIEAITSFDFDESLPDSIEDILESKCEFYKWKN